MINIIDRKKFIGGSEIAAAMGLSRWKTPLQLWAEKTGRVDEKDLSDVEAVQLGTELEEFVAKKFERVAGMKVRRAPKQYIHETYDYMRCQVDRLIESTDMLLECKTCSAWKAKEWEGEEIPQEYILQVMYQLGITGRSVGYIAVLIGGQSFKWKKIEFDQDLFNQMVKAAEFFWNCVVNEIPPVAMGGDNATIKEMYPTNDETLIEIQEMNEKVKYLQEVKMHIGEMIDEKDKIEAEIKQKIGDNLGIKTGEYVVTWKTQTRTDIDTVNLKRDGLYESYSKQSESRVLRVRKEKENGKPSNG